MRFSPSSPALAATGASGGERSISQLREERLRIGAMVRDADKLRQAGLMSLEAWGAVRLSAMAQLVPGIPLPTLTATASTDAPPAFQALCTVVSWATDNAGRFAGRTGGPGRGPLLGRWAEGGELALLPGPLRAFLIDQGHDDTAILRAWRLRGWLLCEDQRRTARRRVGGITRPCVVFTAQAVHLARQRE
jgi:hypothetical protein